MANEQILIIDDKTESITLLTDLLESLGYRLRLAHTGRGGLQAALTEPPDLLLLDLNLPDMSGLEVMEVLRRRDFAPPIILLTVQSSAEMVMRALRLGVRDYIPSPFDINELLVSIDWALAECRLRSEKEHLLSELQTANDQLTQRMRELVTLQAVGRSIAAVMPRDEVLHRILDAALYLTGADASAVFLVNAQAGDLRLEVVRHAQGYEAGLDLRITDGHALDVLLSGKPVRLAHAQLHSDVTTYLGQRAHSLIYIPVRSGDTSIGVLGVASVQEARDLPAEAESRLTALADYAAIALNNISLYEAVRRQAGQLTAVNRMAQTVVSSLDLDTVIATVVRAVRQSVRAESASLALLDEEAGELVFDVVLGDKDAPVDQAHLALGQGVVGWVVEHGQPARIADVMREPRFFNGVDRNTGFQTRSLLCIPLTVRGRVIGAIEAVNKMNGDSSLDLGGFSPEDEVLLQEAGAFIALAVENARLHAAVRETVAAETLHEAVVTLSHHMNNPLQTLMGAAQSLKHDVADWSAEVPAANAPVTRLANLVEDKVREISIVLSILQDVVVPENKSYVGELQMIDIEAELQTRLAAARPNQRKGI